MSIMPKPWIFFRAMVGSLATFIIFLISWHLFNNVKVVPALIVVGSFAVPFAVLILFFELNTPRNISIFKIVQLVIVGGAISIIFSLMLFQVTPLVGVFGASAAGIIEEYGKLVALITFLGTLGVRKYKYRLNALLLGAAVGTGFAAFESAGYALEAGMFQSADEMISVIQLRGLLSPFAHIAWTAIAASAFWLARPKFSDSIDTIFSFEFLKLFALPVGLHFVWNFPFDGLFMMKYWILGFIAWVVIISLVQSGLKEVGHIARNNQ
ncbi:MAG: PrsW family glutamic-type intramembrane protease [Methylotenera sp.]|nr:PrsW family glutamic-type intramembrane protease [Methylotenera sp.]